MDELQKYQILISNISDLVYICDTAGKILFVNPVFEKLSGHKSEDFSGKSFAPLFDEMSLGTANDAYARTLNGESPVYELVFKDTGVLCEYKNFPMRNAGGEIVGVMGIARDISERKRAEEELRESVKRYRLLFESNPHPMWVYDLETLAFLAVNDAAMAHYGYSREEFLSMTIKDIRPSEDIPRLLDNISHVTVAGGLDRAGVWRHIKKDGTAIDVEIVSHTQDFGGRRAEVVLATDITARLQAEQALRESKQRLRAIIDAEPECVKVIDAEGRILDINPAGAAMLEAVAPDVVIGESIYPFIAPEYVETTKGFVGSIIFRGAKDFLKFEIVGMKGTRKWVECHAVPLNDEGGSVGALLGITRDITERMKTEEALTREKQRLEDVTAHANCGLLLLDDHARVAYANTVAEQWFGPIEETRGRLCWELFGLKDPERECAGLKVLKTGETVRSDTFTRVVGGEQKRFYLIASPVRDSEGVIRQVTEVVIDITERTRLEEQLLQLQKMESLGQLASGIAHDFNNVLGGILGYADLGLMKIDERHHLHENLFHIAELARKAAGITRQLLAFSRRQVLEQRDVDLNALVANLLRLLGKTLGEHVEIDFIPGQQLHTVYADPVQMEQVLVNLCVNARDAMPGGGKLTIKTCNVTLDEGDCRTYTGVTPGRYVLLSVADTGAGMDAAVRERIFEPFFTTKKTEKGTGLGLSIVYGIVGQHKGCIDVESEPGQGTTFRIYLPTTEGPSTLVQGKVAPAIRGGTETVLVVEDEEEMRNLICHVLKEYGYTVLSAVNGEEGVDLFDKNSSSIALVVSDLVMPRMNGVSLYTWIHSMSPAIKFLFVSGYVPDEERQQLLEGQKLDLMCKPFGSAELVAKVREILDRPSA